MLVILINQNKVENECSPRLRKLTVAGLVTGIEISVSLEVRDLLFFGWACRMFENFNGKFPDYKEMGVRACLRFAVISYATNFMCCGFFFFTTVFICVACS